ncbi:MAG: LicD family protein [Chloroflexi bacterium]|nr:LicD family protein [Chloroflexota bacterium]
MGQTYEALYTTALPTPLYPACELELSPAWSAEDRRQLRLGQQKMTRMLQAVDRICRAHQITYFLTAGSLLGAVLYGGWIPWDGDIDLELLQDDYPTFQLVAQSELPPDLWFQEPATDPAYRGVILGKVRDLYSYYSGWENGPWHSGLQVDLSTFSVEQGIVHSADSMQMTGLIYEDIFPLRELAFDGLIVPVPNRYEAYLDKKYGHSVQDWRQIPPVEKRFPHEGRIVNDVVPEFYLKTYPYLYQR